MIKLGISAGAAVRACHARIGMAVATNIVEMIVARIRPVSNRDSGDSARNSHDSRARNPALSGCEMPANSMSESRNSAVNDQSVQLYSVRHAYNVKPNTAVAEITIKGLLYTAHLKKCFAQHHGNSEISICILPVGSLPRNSHFSPRRAATYAHENNARPVIGHADTLSGKFPACKRNSTNWRVVSREHP